MNAEEMHIGVIILTYNSHENLAACLDGILKQRGIKISVIVVDNASSINNRVTMETIFLDRWRKGVIVKNINLTPAFVGKCEAVFVRNDKNTGYSAGNNIGIKYAVEVGCDAVLILNPDIRITDPNYLATLSTEMYMRPECLIAASRIINLSGLDEHPLRLKNFWEEFFWVRQLAPRIFGQTLHVLPPKGTDPVEAEKVHGSCQLVRATFLKNLGYLDENVFLYCEEAILAAEVKAAGGKIFVFPKLQALHAQVSLTKGNSRDLMLVFIRSRLYYFKHYIDYGPVKFFALYISYQLLAFLHRIKSRSGLV